MAGHLGDFMQWRKRALRHCDRLAERITALDGCMYEGAGFHYALMPDLVETRRQIDTLTADMVPPNPECYRPIVAGVRLESLSKQVAKAEASARQWSSKYNNKKG